MTAAIVFVTIILMLFFAFLNLLKRIERKISLDQITQITQKLPTLDLTTSNKSVKSDTPKNENSNRHTLGIDYIYNLNETLKGAVGASVISQVAGENGDHTALQLRLLSLRFTF